MSEPYDFNIDHLEQLPPQRAAEESPRPPRFRKLAGVLYLLAGLYLPAYIGWELLPEGWADDAAGAVYWWSVPMIITLAGLCLGLIIVGASRLLPGRQPDRPVAGDQPKVPHNPAPQPAPPPRYVRGRAPAPTEYR